MNQLVFAILVAYMAVLPTPVYSSYEYQLSPHQVIVRDLPPVMLRVAIAESNLNPLAKSPTSSAKGIFQILSGTWKDYDCQGDVYNPYDNIACATKIYEESGTTPWNASKSVWGVDKSLPEL